MIASSLLSHNVSPDLGEGPGLLRVPDEVRDGPGVEGAAEAARRLQGKELAATVRVVGAVPKEKLAKEV